MRPIAIILAITILAAATRVQAQEPAGNEGNQRITVETARFDGYQYYDTDQVFIMAHCMLEDASDDNYRVTFRIVNKTPHPTAVKITKFKSQAEILASQGFKKNTLYTYTTYMDKVRRSEVSKVAWSFGMGNPWLYNLNSAEQRAATITMAESAAISGSYLDTCLLLEGQMVDGFVYVSHSIYHQRLKVTAHVGGKDYDFEWRIGNDKCAPVK